MRHWASYNLLPLPPGQFYAVIIQSWACILPLHCVPRPRRCPLPEARLGRGLAAGADLHTCAAGRAGGRPFGRALRVFNNHQNKAHAPVMDPTCGPSTCASGPAPREEGSPEGAGAGPGKRGGPGVQEPGLRGGRGRAQRPAAGPRSPKSRNCFMESGDGEKRA